MADPRSGTLPSHVTAHTAPSDRADRSTPAPTTSAGLVLLYSPAFRTLAPAYPFDRPALELGRDASCAIVLEDNAVSRRHARIAFEHGAWRVTDLESRNGTFVDGEAVSSAPLEPLQELRIGDALFKFVDQGAEHYARFRIDGAIDGAMPATPSALIGGYVMWALTQEIERIARTPLSCIVLGETGTGKEVFARELHRLSGRPGAFQAIHCAAIPSELLESELFGYRRGAFSGATRDKAGLIEQADRGTLFLDEIGDMPLEAQVKLLRVLQSHEVLPLGATKAQRVDLRVVCATHRDLYRYVQEGRFRGDLFARLNEYSAMLPPLRDRKEDIFALTNAFATRHSTRRSEPSRAFMNAVIAYDWPFNVRELESAVKRATVLAEDGVLEPRHLPPQVREATTTSIERGSHPPPPLRAPPEMGVLRGPPTEETLRELLARHQGNVAAVGRDLGKARMQVHRWLKRYGIEVDKYRAGT